MRRSLSGCCVVAFSLRNNSFPIAKSSSLVDTYRLHDLARVKTEVRALSEIEPSYEGLETRTFECI